MPNALMQTNNNHVIAPLVSREQAELLKRTMAAKDVSDDEFKVYVMQCNRLGLDPFNNQICAVSRYNKKTDKNEMTVQIRVDGYRLIAERTGLYGGQTAPLWCGKDKAWTEVWLEDDPPAACKVGVYKKGCSQAFWGIAHWRSSAKYYTRKDGGEYLSEFWAKDAPGMLAKCAEIAAIRKAFPHETIRLSANMDIQENESISLFPDMSNDWENETIHDNWIPPELRGLGITFRRLATDEALVYKYQDKEHKARAVLHQWQTYNNYPDEIKKIASLLLQKYPSKTKNQEEKQEEIKEEKQDTPPPAITSGMDNPIPASNPIPATITVPTIENPKEVFDNPPQCKKPERNNENLPSLLEQGWENTPMPLQFKKARGRSWKQMAIEDNDYLTWLSQNAKNPAVGEIAKAALDLTDNRVKQMGEAPF